MLDFIVDSLTSTHIVLSAINYDVSSSLKWNVGTTEYTTPTVTHELNSLGVLSITLSETTVGPTPETFTVTHSVLITDFPAPQIVASIRGLVGIRVPFGQSFNSQAIIEKWLIYLRYGPYPKLKDSEVMDETKWPSDFRVLVSELVSYEVLVNLFNEFAVLGAQLSLEQAKKIIESSSSSSGGESQGGVLKKLQTGPSLAEWYNPLDSNQLETGSKLLLSYFSQRDGLLKEYKQLICIWASRCQVHIPEFCGVRNISVSPTKLRVTKYRGPCRG